MNIFVMQKDAKTLGLYDEFKPPLEEMVNPLYCWDVAWRSGLFSTHPDALIIKNRATDFCAVVGGITSLEGIDIKETVRHGIENAFKVLNVDQEIIDQYFEKAGEFNYGLIRDSRITSRLTDRARRIYIGYKDWDLLEDKDNERDDPPPLKPIAPDIRDGLSQTLTLYANNAKDPSGQLEGSLLHNTVKAMEERFFEGEFPESNVMAPPHRAYEFLITLDLADDYKATRRIVVPDDMNFGEFYLTIIAAYDWWNYHLSEFTFLKPKEGSRKRNLPEEVKLVMDVKETLSYYLDEPEETVLEMDEHCLDEFVEDYEEIYYTYDFGDDWVHEVELVAIHENYTGETPYLLEASMSTPPEDVGGVDGFERFRKAMKDKRSFEYQYQYKDWIQGRGGWSPKLNKKLRAPRKLEPLKYIDPSIGGWY